MGREEKRPNWPVQTQNQIDTPQIASLSVHSNRGKQELASMVPSRSRITTPQGLTLARQVVNRAEPNRTSSHAPSMSATPAGAHALTATVRTNLGWAERQCTLAQIVVRNIPTRGTRPSSIWPTIGLGAYTQPTRLATSALML